jgi:hypothetical protein
MAGPKKIEKLQTIGISFFFDKEQFSSLPSRN